MVFHIYQDVVGQWRWYLAGPNVIKIANAPIGYARRNDCLQAIKRVREAGASPVLYDNFGPIASVSAAMVA